MAFKMMMGAEREAEPVRAARAAGDHVMRLIHKASEQDIKKPVTGTWLLGRQETGLGRVEPGEIAAVALAGRWFWYGCGHQSSPNQPRFMNRTRIRVAPDPPCRASARLPPR